MSEKETKLMKYYTSGEYNGFYLMNNSFGKSGKTSLTLTDGQRIISMTGAFREEALVKAFQEIDRCEAVFNFNS